MGNDWKSVGNDDFQNIGNMSKDDFDTWMIKNFGEAQYEDGFQIIYENKELLELDDNHQEIADKIQDIGFKSTEAMISFISSCESFILN